MSNSYAFIKLFPFSSLVVNLATSISIKLHQLLAFMKFLTKLSLKCKNTACGFAPELRVNFNLQLAIFLINFFLQATSLCVQGQKLLNYYQNFNLKVAQQLLRKISMNIRQQPLYLQLNDVRILTKSFYTNIYTACIVFLA